MPRHLPLEPHLLAEWDWALNIDSTPDTARSTSTVWWICPEGHSSYELSINRRRYSGVGCPVCNPNILTIGINDFATLQPEKAKQWSKKNDISPSEIREKSNKVFLWECDLGHEWKSKPLNRVLSNTGCPICSHKKLLKGFNDFATLCPPDLAAEIHPTLNAGLDITSFIGFPARKIWWLGAECGHEWEARILSRYHGAGCPFCSGNKVLSGFNDFATHYPHWVDLWHPEKNGDLLPSQVMKKSPGKRWWRCEKGHEWEQSPKKMALMGPRCPRCEKVFSPMEEMVERELRKLYQGEIHPRRRIIEHTPGFRGRWEIDLLLPELKLGFEVQDFATHSRDRDDEPMNFKGSLGVKGGPTKHELKRRLAMEQHGVTLVDLWEDEILNGSFKEVMERSLEGALGGGFLVQGLLSG